MVPSLTLPFDTVPSSITAVAPTNTARINIGVRIGVVLENERQSRLTYPVPSINCMRLQVGMSLRASSLPSANPVQQAPVRVKNHNASKYSAGNKSAFYSK